MKIPEQIAGEGRREVTHAPRWASPKWTLQQILLVLGGFYSRGRGRSPRFSRFQGARLQMEMATVKLFFLRGNKPVVLA